MKRHFKAKYEDSAYHMDGMVFHSFLTERWYGDVGDLRLFGRQRGRAILPYGMIGVTYEVEVCQWTGVW